VSRDKQRSHGENGETRAGFYHAAVIAMVLAEFLLLTWLGLTVIGDTAGRSLLIAFLLTTVTILGLWWDRRRR
jgi:hypothetical protein